MNNSFFLFVLCNISKLAEIYLDISLQSSLDL